MTWPTDEQVRDAAIALYGVDIGFPASMEKIAAMFDALPDDEPAWYMAKARAALTAVNPFEWRPIETAPKDGAEILGTDGVAVHVCYRKMFRDDVWEYFRDEINAPGHTWSFKPTHWMPLPLPPTEGK